MADGAGPGDAKYDAAMKKSEELQKKIDQLSEADKAIRLEEFTKLWEEAKKLFSLSLLGKTC